MEEWDEDTKGNNNHLGFLYGTPRVFRGTISEILTLSLSLVFVILDQSDKHRVSFDA